MLEKRTTTKLASHHRSIYSLPSPGHVEVLWGSPKGWGEGGTPTPPGSREATSRSRGTFFSSIKEKPSACPSLRSDTDSEDDGQKTEQTLARLTPRGPIHSLHLFLFVGGRCRRLWGRSNNLLPSVPASKLSPSMAPLPLHLSAVPSRSAPSTLCTQWATSTTTLEQCGHHRAIVATPDLSQPGSNTITGKNLFSFTPAQ